MKKPWALHTVRQRWRFNFSQGTKNLTSGSKKAHTSRDLIIEIWGCNNHALAPQIAHHFSLSCVSCIATCMLYYTHKHALYDCKNEKIEKITLHSPQSSEWVTQVL